ncbi:MAG TPA: c-type cytochrome [Ferruginibacter sp.]|jgi:thiosulfate dehydrogenase|nr:c-type cytochrome [Ferruginibacter sp.]
MLNDQEDEIKDKLVAIINKLLVVIAVLVLALVLLPVIFYYDHSAKKEEKPAAKKEVASYWIAPDINTITDPKLKEQVRYGKELIAHTSKYLGPKGTVMQISNGMNCQNCHLQAGTAIFGNNYGSVASTYPKFRARSGTIENIYKRVNDCFERSLNGKALDTTGKEMQAIEAYIKFLGSNVEKGKKAEGSGFKDLAYLDRAADPAKGALVYTAKCQTCHQSNGGGLYTADSTEYTYPALWGNSFNEGAGLNRISNFAKYVKYNMPLGTTYQYPQLTDEEAWDVAAYVVTQKRPAMNMVKDWPDITKKPIDLPFGPYADNFSEQQHKYGPFKPIADEQKKKEADKQKIAPAKK